MLRLLTAANGTKRRKPRREFTSAFGEQRKCMDGGPRLPSTRMIRSRLYRTAAGSSAPRTSTTTVAATPRIIV